LAEQECKKYNGHLVTIETKNKMDFVQQLAISMSRSHPILEIYIGKEVKRGLRKTHSRHNILTDF
jgi:hypothetical protein